MPSDSNCSLTITGTADEVVDTAATHTAAVHGHEDTPQLRAELRKNLTNDEAPTEEGAFVQLIEFRTDRIDDFTALVDKWQAEIGSARTARWAVTGVDRDRPGTYVQIVEFPNYEQAMANSEHPVTRALAEQMAKLADGEATFRNLDVSGTSA